MSVAAAVLAGGSGRRMGANDNKVYLPIGGRPVIDRSLEVLDRCEAVEIIVVVVRPEDRGAADAAVERSVAATPVRIVPGGESRTGSELAALDVVAEMGADRPALTLIHDAARPFLTHDLLDRLLAAADAVGGAIPGVPVTDPLVDVADGRPIGRSVSDLVRVQTPQVFRTALLLDAYASLDPGAASVDTAEVIEQHGGAAVSVVESDERNLKVTHPVDLDRAEQLAGSWAAGAWTAGR
ncbi:MAG: IspD/TarI family cytidylyltransferase [Actinomycetota bacterium]